MASKSKFYYTLLGFLTIIIWGTSAIFTRNLSTGLGAYTSAARWYRGVGYATDQERGTDRYP